MCGRGNGTAWWWVGGLLRAASFFPLLQLVLLLFLTSVCVFVCLCLCWLVLMFAQIRSPLAASLFYLFAATSSISQALSCVCGKKERSFVVGKAKGMKGRERQVNDQQKKILKAEVGKSRQV